MGNLVYVWECDKAAHRNDWALAMVYWRVGIDRFAQNESYFAGEGPKVLGLIPKAGYRREDGQIENTIDMKRIYPEVEGKESDWRFN
jgi:hypothetical protein